jgi:hypothetical protein
MKTKKSGRNVTRRTVVSLALLWVPSSVELLAEDIPDSFLQLIVEDIVQ